MSNARKLSKLDRLTFIASLCGGAMAASLAPTRHDVSEEAHLITHGQDSGKLTISDDLPELASSLPFEQVTEDKGDDSILSPGERKGLARDLTAYRIKQDLNRARNPFAIALIS